MKTLIVSIIILLIIFSGCQFLPGGGGDGEIPDVSIIYKGTDGLTMKFKKGFPPEIIASGREFPIVLEIHNKGASGIDGGIIIINRQENLIPKLEPSRFVFNLKGKDTFALIGESDLLQALAESKKIEPEYSPVNPEAIFVATACYKYTTKFMKGVCIDTHKFRVGDEDKPCEAKDLTASSQGAPVAVKKVEVRLNPEADLSRIEPSFRIFIKNVGNGDIIAHDSLNVYCGTEDLREHPVYAPLRESRQNKLSVWARLGQVGLECNTQDGWVQLTGDESEDYVDCTLKEGYSTNLEPFVQDLSVLLVYGYKITESTTVELEKEKSPYRIT